MFNICQHKLSTNLIESLKVCAIAANEPGHATFRERLPSLRSKCAEATRKNQSPNERIAECRGCTGTEWRCTAAYSRSYVQYLELLHSNIFYTFRSSLFYNIIVKYCFGPISNYIIFIIMTDGCLFENNIIIFNCKAINRSRSINFIK
jgi:hypothetical protein